MEFRLKNDLNEIQLLAEAIELFGEENNLPSKDLFQVNLALDELLTNTISYGYPDTKEHEILIKYTIEDAKDLVIEVRDDGLPFDPLEREDPDITQDIDERSIGGLGIYLVRQMMDDINYRWEDGYNVLSMRKNLRLS